MILVCMLIIYWAYDHISLTLVLNQYLLVFSCFFFFFWIHADIFFCSFSSSPIPAYFFLNHLKCLMNFFLSSTNKADLFSLLFSAHAPSVSLLRYSNVTTRPRPRSRKWWRTSSMLCAPAWCCQPIGSDSSEGKGFSLWILCSGEIAIQYKGSRFNWM